MTVAAGVFHLSSKISLPLLNAFVGQSVPNGAHAIASLSSPSTAFLPKTLVRIKRKRVVPDTPSKRRRSADCMFSRSPLMLWPRSDI
jgi:hypothetical protein